MIDKLMLLAVSILISAGAIGGIALFIYGISIAVAEKDKKGWVYVCMGIILIVSVVGTAALMIEVCLP